MSIGHKFDLIYVLNVGGVLNVRCKMIFFSFCVSVFVCDKVSSHTGTM
jgi:hypothetical protein